MAALLLALDAGADPEACREVLAHFRGLPHRLEWVADLKGVAFYDDSKGTNVGAVARSLDYFDRPVQTEGLFNCSEIIGNDFYFFQSAGTVREPLFFHQFPDFLDLRTKDALVVDQQFEAVISRRVVAGGYHNPGRKRSVWLAK